MKKPFDQTRPQWLRRLKAREARKAPRTPGAVVVTINAATVAEFRRQQARHCVDVLKPRGFLIRLYRGALLRLRKARG